MHSDNSEKPQKMGKMKVFKRIALVVVITYFAIAEYGRFRCALIPRNVEIEHKIEIIDSMVEAMHETTDDDFVLLDSMSTRNDSTAHLVKRIIYKRGCRLETRALDFQKRRQELEQKVAK